MSRYLASLVLLLFSFITSADVGIEELAQLTKTPEQLAGKFTQEKYLNTIDVTLDSSGEFVYQRNQSMRWITLVPIENELLLTPTSMINKQGETELAKIDLDNNPTTKMIGEIFFAVLTADWQALEKFFTINAVIEQADWKVDLIPNDGLLKQIMSRVELQGGEFLQQIIIHEVGKNRTTIVFSQLTEQAGL